MEDRFYNNATKGKTSLGSFILGFILILVFTMIIPGIVLIIYEYVSSKSIDEINQYFVTNMPFIFATIGIFLSIKFIHRRPIKSIITSSKKISIFNFMCGFLVWLFIPLTLLIINYFADPSYYKFTFDLHEFIPIFLIGIVLTFIQVLAEELFFRGYINQAFGIKIKNIILLSIVSGLLFMCAHLANPEVSDNGILALLLYFWLGFLFSYVVLKYDSLEIAVGMHYANNMFAIFILSYQNSVMGSTPSVFTESSDTNFLAGLILNIIIGLINLGIFSVIFKYKKKRKLEN